MMQPNLIPFLAIVLINVAVLVYVWQERGQTKSGFFLMVNALSLIIWAGGSALYRGTGGFVPMALSLPYLAALLVPANFAWLALTRPTPLRPRLQGPVPLAICFGPAIFLAFFQSFNGSMATLFDYSLRTDSISLGFPMTRLAIFYTFLCLTVALTVLGVRYNTGRGPEQVVAKHLIITIIGPILFAGFFWVASRQGGPPVMPSPAFVMALMAQIGLIAVLRQEDLRRRKTLRRVVYQTTAVLVASLLVGLMAEFYYNASGWIITNRTTAWLVLGAALVLILATRFSRVEATLDSLLFARAEEYRRLVDEAQNELRETRERLRRSERLSVMGELAARMAHEVKNPLGPIKGYAQMMREKLDDDPSFAHRDRFLDYLDIIAEEVENIDKRIRHFLDNARQPQMLLEPMPLNRVVERCARLIRLEADSLQDRFGLRGVEVDLDLDPQISTILADQGRVEEALFNVARNALDVLQGRADGIIFFQTRTEEGPRGEPGVAIIVRDNGPGFDTGEMTNLFDPFVTHKTNGTGLGLAIVKSAIESHGGIADLSNLTEGGGAVRLWLPLEARPKPGAVLPKGHGNDSVPQPPKETPAATR